MSVKLIVHQNTFKVVKKHTLLGCISEVSDSEGLGGALKFAFLTGFCVLLLIQGPHFENHCFSPEIFNWRLLPMSGETSGC